MNDPSATDSPSPASLGKAFAIAAGIAALLLVLVVLPAERNIDPTGFGRAIGLTVLSAPPPGEGPAPAPPPAPATGPPAGAPGIATRPADDAREDQAFVDLPAGKGVEYKVRVRAGEKLRYSWKCDAGELFYDFHGEPAGAAKDVFESFAAGVSAGAKGTLTAPFDGTHGWYWKNRSANPIRVTLDTGGRYEIVGIR
jgi:hypothetical protein